MYNDFTSLFSISNILESKDFFLLKLCYIFLISPLKRNILFLSSFGGEEKPNGYFSF